MSEEAQWRLCFAMFDLTASGQLAKSDVTDIVRICGRHHTPHQLEMALTDLPEKISLDKFLSFMRNSVYKGPADKDVVTALQAFDTRETGELSRADVTLALSGLNEKLTPAECDLILAMLPFGTGGGAPIPGISEAMLMQPAHIKCSIQDVVAACTKS